jgi:regulator of replication initiation timing
MKPNIYDLDKMRQNLNHLDAAIDRLLAEKGDLLKKCDRYVGDVTRLEKENVELRNRLKDRDKIIAGLEEELIAANSVEECW